MKILFLIFIASGFFLKPRAYAYTNFIGYGYAACLTCHYNAFGNGPLNDYGRALGANLIAGRLFIPDSVSDSKLSEYSGFFGKVNYKSTFFRPSLDYRGIMVTDNFGQGGSENRYYHMQLDGNVVLRMMQDKFIMSFSYGMLPEEEGFGSKMKSISREHYLMYAFSNKFRIYAGKMDVVFGVRVPDHILFARARTGIAQNDQSHGVVAHWYNESFELGVNYFVGDLSDDADVRLAGFSSMLEYNLASDFRVGASILSASHEFLSRTLAALHARVGFFKGASLVAEYGFLHDQEITDLNTGVTTKASDNYFFLQSMIKLKRGLHNLTTFERYTNVPEGSTENTAYRMTTGLQWFPLPRFEIRSEISAGRIFLENNVNKDSWTFLNQIHLWF
ncbi:MAG: hypothetical protein H6621_08565 [Halobacteriovoraceae bacterium]|nr:hypothetical protein [Halobacteriovoraceae bacterium]MCB9095105.1 hypothetical protein [Halobacteriovoraceae bacterium]